MGKKRGKCLKKNKWKTCDGTLDVNQCTSKKCACCYPNCCKRSSKCEAAGGFCTTDPASCAPGTTNSKLCKGKNCTCCIMRVCFNDADSAKSCSSLGGQCTTDKNKCRKNGGKYKKNGCSYKPESGEIKDVVVKR